MVAEPARVHAFRRVETLLRYSIALARLSGDDDELGVCEMNEYDTAVDRVASHANLPSRGKEAKDEDSLLYELGHADHGRSHPRLELIDDVVQCLFVLNTCLNGPDPNSRIGQSREPVPDNIAYSVACIIEGCLRYHRRWSANHLFSDDVLQALLIGTHRIALCWEQVLAGDITDLLEGFDYL